MKFFTKVKFVLAAFIVMLILVFFMAFNSFGIDADTIYTLQGEMDASTYNSARGYAMTGNTIQGLFASITEEEDEDSNLVTGTGVDDGSSTWTGETVNTTGSVNITETWLATCDRVHKTWGMLGYKYSNKGATATITDDNGNAVTVRLDCSGYVSYCAYLMGWTGGESRAFTSDGDLSAFGFTSVPPDQLQSGDVIAYSGHIEVYVGPGKEVYNWGGSASAENKYAGVTDASTVNSVSTSGKFKSAAIVTVWRPPSQSSTSSSSGDKIVFVDAGHGCNYGEEYKGTRDEGWAKGGAAGEADWAAMMASKFISELQNRGYTVITINDCVSSTPTGETPREYYGNIGRAKLFDASNASVMIQFHYDGLEGAYTASGAHAIYCHNDDANKKLAQCLISNWAENTGIPVRSSYAGGISLRTELGVGYGSSKPICLIECGFGAPGYADYAALRDNSTQDAIIKTLADGIDSYFQ